MVSNATFNNISVISWRSVLLVEETGENDRPATITLTFNLNTSTQMEPCFNMILSLSNVDMKMSLNNLNHHFIVYLKQ